MFNLYRFPPNYLPFWHIGARAFLGPYRKFLLRMKRQGKDRLLDIGSGSGWHSLVAARLGMHVVASDLSEQRLENVMAVARWAMLEKNIATLAADGRSLPLPDESKDIVVASHVIEHIDHPEKLLQEINRVLVPGGVLVLSCPSKSHGMRIMRWMGISVDPDDHKVKGFSEEEIAAMLPEAMAVDQVSYQGRWIESNVMDIEAIFSKATGLQANPEKSLWQPANSISMRILVLLKEAFLLPLVALSKLENSVGSFYRGSIINCIITKRGSRS